VEVKAKLEHLGTEYKSKNRQLEQQQKTISGYQAELDSLPQKENELARLTTLKKTLRELEQQISENQFAQTFREQLIRYQQDMQRLDYSTERHAELQKKIHEQRKAESDWQTLQEKKTLTVQLEERLKHLTHDTATLLSTIEHQNFCVDEHKQIKQIEENILPLQKELEKREALQNEQSTLQNALVEINHLTQAKTKLPEVIHELDELQDKAKQLQTQFGELQQKILDAAALVETYEEQRVLFEEIQTERKAVETGRNALYQEIGSVQARKEALEKRKAETITLREQLDAVAKDIRYNEILRRAFSRDGIPAMMVEQALPELEEDANRLLRRLTHGSCTVKFQTQRESKTGGMKETLDILISDEMGTRDYDMFSGGEAFRTDLAIRIALSQLLCRRAGSRLQLLVIDEGFGTQDAEGLSNIVDAIDEIQDEFEKVLVVTHIEELKDRFRDRIEVIKDPGIGSRFQVVHAL
jgi:exonuclease SbcC